MPFKYGRIILKLVVPCLVAFMVKPPCLFCGFPRLPRLAAGKFRPVAVRSSSGGLRIFDVESAVFGQALLDEVLGLEWEPEYSNNAGSGFSVILVFPVDIVTDGPCARTDLLVHFLFLSALPSSALVGRFQWTPEGVSAVG